MWFPPALHFCDVHCIVRVISHLCSVSAPAEHKTSGRRLQYLHNVGVCATSQTPHPSNLNTMLYECQDVPDKCTTTSNATYMQSVSAKEHNTQCLILWCAKIYHLEYSHCAESHTPHPSDLYAYHHTQQIMSILHHTTGPKWPRRVPIMFHGTLS